MYALRYRRITFYFARVLAGLIFWELVLPRLRLGRVSHSTRSRRLRRIGRSYRNLAVQMGGVLIKVGQFLSARVDVLPEEITFELSGLQDEVPPAPFEAIQDLAERELGGRLSERFAAFDPQPLAAASLGQVHRARLPANTDDMSTAPEGRGVVVKVQRPDIEQILATDLAALRTVGTWLQRYPPIKRRADVPALLEEFSRVLYEEIDYLAEGRNVETFATQFKDRPGVRVPAVYWSHTTERVLTLEDVYAIKITDYGEIEAAGISRPDVASRLFQTYMQQIFEDGFVHADPHPGNLFVQAAGVDQPSPAWTLTFVDFGMVARVEPQIRAGLRQMAIGLATQDSSRLIRAYQMMGVLLPSADLSMLEKAEKQVFARVWGRSMSELRNISMEEVREFGKEFRQLLYDLPFQVPQDMIFLARTVAILSGMCTGLDPEFNFWYNLAPYAQRFLAEESGPVLETWLETLVEWMRRLAALPGRVDHLLDRMEKGELAVQTPSVDQQLRRMDHSLRRLVGAVVFTALLLSGVQFYLSDRGELAWPLGAAAGLALVWILISKPD